jgi:ADP-ribosylglycohydrolase
MALCALDSLSTGVFDPADVMARFARWYYEDAYTPSGEMFDVGATCAEAIERYRVTGKWEGCARSDERANGNGALMRIYPFVLFAYAKGLTEDARDGLIATATALTHGHPRAALGCMIYAHVLCRLLDAPTHDSVREALASAAVRYASHAELAHYARVLSPDFERTPKESIRSGGYCVDTLEAALYTLLTTESYEACVLSAVNLGEDTDTTAATVGALAGARYGEDAIPHGWLSALLRRPWIEEMCESFAACAKASTTAP